MSASKTTFEGTRPPLPARLVMGVCDALERVGVPLLDIDLAKLRASVEKETGLHDWGDPRFYDDLLTHAEFARRNTNLNVTGKNAVRDALTRHMRNYLSLEEAQKRRPDLATQPVTRPIIIVGLPRTGTTLLQRVLSQDPASRGPALWELFNPVVINTKPDADRARKEGSERFVRFLQWASRSLWSIHPMLSNEADECAFILPHSIGDTVIHAGMECTDWYLKRDAAPDYEIHKKYLQSLQLGQAPRRWVLKSPLHLPKLETLLKTYPDACIIFCHRSLKNVMASWFSYMATAAKFTCKKVDARQVAAIWLNVWKRSMDIALEVRARSAPQQFFDVEYKKLVRSPVQMARDIYAHFDLPWSDAGERAMQNWLDKDKKSGREEHRYALEEFGVSKEALADNFRAYLDRFNVTID